MTKRPFKHRNTERARKLRNEASPVERKLWQYLNKRQLAGYKFSRQIPVGPYVCDFICRKQKLIVELDGFSHESQQVQDWNRTNYLERHDYKVIRFTNEEIFQNVEGVLTKIEQFLIGLNSPTPSPSRLREGS